MLTKLGVVGVAGLAAVIGLGPGRASPSARAVQCPNEVRNAALGEGEEVYVCDDNFQVVVTDPISDSGRGGFTCGVVARTAGDYREVLRTTLTTIGQGRSTASAALPYTKPRASVEVFLRGGEGDRCNLRVSVLNPRWRRD